MKKSKILTKPTRLTELSFDELFDDSSNESELKAERLLTRQMRKFKHETN